MDMLIFVDAIAVIIDKEEDKYNILQIMKLTLKKRYNMKINKIKTKVLFVAGTKETKFT